MSIPGFNLKHITCPAGSECTNVNCLFNHAFSTPEPTFQPIADITDSTLAPTAPCQAAPLPTFYDPAVHILPPTVSGPSFEQPIGSELPKTASAGYKRARSDVDIEHDHAELANPKRGRAAPSGSPITQLVVSTQIPSASPGPQQKYEFSKSSSSSLVPTPVPVSAPLSEVTTNNTASAKIVMSQPTQKRPVVSVRVREAASAAVSKQMTISPTIATESPTSAPPLSKQADKSASSTPSSVTFKPTAAAPQLHKPPSPPKKGGLLTPKTVNSQPTAYAVRVKVIQLLQSEFVRMDSLFRKAHPTRTDLFLSQDDADMMALDIEHRVATGSGAVYRNALATRLSGFKKMSVDDWLKERDIVVNPSKPRGLDAPIIVDTGLTSDQEVAVANMMLTSIEKLANHGYVPKPPKEVDVQQAAKAILLSNGWEKCDRCTQRFQIFPDRRIEDGAHTSGGKCIYHPGRPYFPSNVTGSAKTSRSKADRKYRCCNQGIEESAGCTTTDCHVFKVTDPPRLAHVLPFQETPDNKSPASSAKVACFDCEMCYTVNGIELVRLTVTAWPSGDIILDVLVRPQGAILDLNSRYSGVFPQDITNAKPWTGFEPPIAAPPLGDKTVVRSGELKIVESPAKARELFFKLITRDTILIGHGLENDLNATRIIHPKVIDTVLLFPHKAGLPIRNGLRALADIHINWKIQTDNGAGLGHDSAEDARAAGELVRVKIKEKWKLMQNGGWRIQNGKIVAPK